ERNADQFFQLLQTMPHHVPKELHYVKKAFIKYEDGIRMAFKKSYSNARLENLHTHIKTLKRVSYGFRSFSNMRTRVFLMNGLIQYA
ncbi:transposase, partial [Isobaculum melis]